MYNVQLGHLKNILYEYSIIKLIFLLYKRLMVHKKGHSGFAILWINYIVNDTVFKYSLHRAPITVSVKYLLNILTHDVEDQSRTQTILLSADSSVNRGFVARIG